MNRYDPRTPRTMSGFAAVAMTAATLAIAVYGPAMLDRGAPEADLATRVAGERCVPADGSLMTAMDVVALPAPRAGGVTPVAQSRDARAQFVRG